MIVFFGTITPGTSMSELLIIELAVANLCPSVPTKFKLFELLFAIILKYNEVTNNIIFQLCL